VWCCGDGRADDSPLRSTIPNNCLLCGCSARKLTDEARTAIVNYFSVYKVTMYLHSMISSWAQL
jgi:hypothetical protein